ncbi:MAG: hypothetical protein LBQ66_08460 [Planctomycetaceae bacterium]|nr:hypothetical protein [Planctomycetaceae bacterium]
MANVLQHVLAFLPNSFGFLMHRGGRDARVPVRAASRQLSATPTGGVWNINTFHTPSGRWQALPLQHQCFFGFADAYSAPIVGEYADAIHQESLAVGCPPYVCQHVLAFSSNSFGFLMHRGGRDARVPVRAASRQLSATPPQRKLTNSVCRIVIKVSEVGRTSRIGKARVSRGSISVTKL